MTWIVEALEIADQYGRGIGRYRLTAKSDEDGGGPFGDRSHDHGSKAEAEACQLCREFTDSVTGIHTERGQCDALEEENAALRKAVSKLQAEVLGLVSQKWVKLEDHQALLAWAAKAEAVRAAAEDVAGWARTPRAEVWPALDAALSSCPPLESVTKEAL
jgi:hypothetical protein